MYERSCIEVPSIYLLTIAEIPMFQSGHDCVGVVFRLRVFRFDWDRASRKGYDYHTTHIRWRLSTSRCFFSISSNCVLHPWVSTVSTQEHFFPELCQRWSRCDMPPGPHSKLKLRSNVIFHHCTFLSYVIVTSSSLKACGFFSSLLWHELTYVRGQPPVPSINSRYV